MSSSFIKISDDGTVSRRRTTKKSKNAPKDGIGTVYLLRMELGDIDNTETIWKIGVTRRKTRGVETRVCEIIADHFRVYRYFPKVYVKRYRKTEYPYEVEALLHRGYKDVQYTPEKPFSGSTELFRIDDVDRLLELYEEVMDNPLDYIIPNRKVSKPKILTTPAEVNTSVVESINDFEPVTPIDFNDTTIPPKT